MQELGDASDGQIARAIAHGKTLAAEDELMRRFSRRVFLYGIRHLGDETQAQDLAQDVMATMLVKLRAGEVREPDRIGSFILGTARWMARDERRRQWRSRTLEVALSNAQSEIDEAEAPLNRELLSRSVAQLPERERTVIVLTFFSAWTATEIAESMGITVGNVRVIRHRALRRLYQLMGVDGPRGTSEAS